MNKTRFPEEPSLWQLSFPQLLSFCEKQGAHLMRVPQQILLELQAGNGLDDPAAAAAFRIELTCSYLWPQVQQLFQSDLFDHLLAAATAILRALEFGEPPSATDRSLREELIQALIQAEQLLGEMAPAQAAEPKPELTH